MCHINKSDPNVARESQIHPKRNVAVVGIFDAQQRILLVRTKRFPDHWQPIGGGMRPGDGTPINTILREITEEMGVQFPPNQLTLHLTTDYDFGEGKVFFYVAHLPDDCHPKFDPGELLEWKWFRKDELVSVQTFPATSKFLLSL